MGKYAIMVNQEWFEELFLMTMSNFAHKNVNILFVFTVKTLLTQPQILFLQAKARSWDHPPQ